ncbi:MAG: hypothetical protein ACKOA8_12300 [Deltaproteobacteria bacterium]
MSATLLNFSREHFSTVTQELLENLAREPFAHQNKFQDLTIEEMGAILEHPIDESSPLVESYDSTKSTYCLLLLDLELNGHHSLPQIFKEAPLKDLTDLPTESLQPNSPENLSKVEEILKERNIDLEADPITALNSIPEVISELNTTLPKEAPTASELSDSILVRDYRALTQLFFENLEQKTVPISVETANRVAIQFLITSCEVELFEKIKPVVELFWPNRQEKIKELLQVNQFKFNESVSSQINADEKEYAKFLFDNKFPRLATLHCLKYLTLTNSLDSLHPSVFELGTLFYFWSSNLLSVDPSTKQTISVTEAQWKQLAFRLFRMDRIKGVTTNFNRPLAPDFLTQARDDGYFVSQFLKEIVLEQQIPQAA